MKRSAQALRPGGYLAIEEFQRFQSFKEVGNWVRFPTSTSRPPARQEPGP